MGHPDTQDFGRKVKIAFSGCEQNPCGLVTMHDMGAIAKTRVVDGKKQRGFAFYVGGGLGSVPYKAKLFDEFLPEEELLPTMQAISRVFARLGEKRNRARARIKFLIAHLGIEEFKKLVAEERQKLAHRSALDRLSAAPSMQWTEQPLKPGLSLNGHQRPEGFEAWYTTNVYKQRQPGYVAATVSLPLGDASADQLRALADIARRFVKDTLRTTVEQNILFRWVSEADLPEFYQAIKAIGLGAADAATIVDVTACPGTDTCKLGIASSRGLARELRQRLGEKSLQLDEAVKNLRIKVSGCFNSCGQHHIADIGFYGINRNVKGGFRCRISKWSWAANFTTTPANTAWPIGAVPSKRDPRSGADRSPNSYMRAATEGRTVSSFHRPHRQEGGERSARRSDQDSRPRCRSVLFTAIGATRASLPWRTWASASAPAKWSARRSLLWPPASASCSKRNCCSTPATRNTR